MSTPKELRGTIEDIEAAGEAIPFGAASDAVEALGFAAVQAILAEAMTALDRQLYAAEDAAGAIRHAEDVLDETVMRPMEPLHDESRSLDVMRASSHYEGAAHELEEARNEILERRPVYVDDQAKAARRHGHAGTRARPSQVTGAYEYRRGSTRS